jgi:polysaccharide export outer membrane protein
MNATTIQNIFLVDDDPFYLAILEQHIRNAGYDQITQFSDGSDCLNALHQNPDVIFLDHNMDTYSGYEVLKKIKRFNPNIHVVMVSGQEEIQTAVDALKHGAFDYITKSGNDSIKVQEVLEKLERVRELEERRRPSLLKTVFSLF